MLPLAVGLYLLWLVLGQLRGQGEEVRAMFREGLGHWPWWLLALASFLAAQLLRAWRWQVMLDEPGTFWLGFRAISVSFLASLAVSRLAELVRIVFHHRHSGAPLGKLASTTFADRMLDTCVFCLLMMHLMLSDAQAIREHFPRLLALRTPLALVIAAGFALLLALIFAAGPAAALAGRLPFLSAGLREAAASFVRKLAEGLRFVRRPRILVPVVLSTGLTWVFYFLAFYAIAFPFRCFEGHLGLFQASIVFACSTLGMAVPSPGGLGSYHWFTAQGLQVFCGLGGVTAASLTAFMFFLQIWGVNLLVGAGSWIVQLCLRGRPPAAAPPAP